MFRLMEWIMKRHLPLVVAVTLGIDCVCLGESCPPDADFGFMGTTGASGEGYGNQADASVAMGPGFGIALSNWQIVRFDIHNEIVESQDFVQFFDVILDFDTVGDVVIRFDSDSNRFFIIVQHNDDIGLAVSTDSAPSLDDATDWHEYTWNVSPALHYHNIEIGDDYVYITALVNGDKARPLIGYAPKSGLLSGTQTTFTWGQVGVWQSGLTHHVGCVKDYDRASDIGRFVSFSRVDDEPYIRLYAVDPPSTSASVYNLEVDDYDPPPGTVDTPNTNDFGCHPNTMISVLRNGHLWTAHAIADGDDTNIRWYEIDLDDWPDVGSTPTVLQTGEIDPPSGTSAIYPALHVDDDGNMAIAWMQCSATEHISIYRAIRRHDDDDDSLRAPLLLHAGDDFGVTTQGLFADYTMMDDDPVQPGVMWAHHMYWFPDENEPPGGERRTWLGLIDVNRSLTNDLTGPNNPPQRGDLLTLTVHGAEPSTTVKWYYSLDGCTEPTSIEPMSVTLDIANAVFLAQTTADSDGTAEKNFTIPYNFPLGDVWIQAAEFENTSEVIETEVVE